MGGNGRRWIMKRCLVFGCGMGGMIKGCLLYCGGNTERKSPIDVRSLFVYIHQNSNIIILIFLCKLTNVSWNTPQPKATKAQNNVNYIAFFCRSCLVAWGYISKNQNKKIGVWDRSTYIPKPHLKSP